MTTGFSKQALQKAHNFDINFNTLSGRRYYFPWFQEEFLHPQIGYWMQK